MRPPFTARAFAFLLVLLASMGLAAQDLSFKVGDHPQPGGMTEAEFKQRVAQAKSEPKFEALLRTAFSELREGVIDYMVIGPDGRGTRKQYSAATRRTATPRAATMATRGNEVLRNRAEFQRLFSDTLVVVGALRVRLGLTDDAFTARGFTVYWTRPGGSEFQYAPVPAQEDALVLDAALLGVAPGDAVEVVLRNSSVPGETLGHCVLIFMPEAGQRELRRALCRWKEEEPGATREQQVDRAASLVEQFHGRPYPPNLEVLLCR